MNVSRTAAAVFVAAVLVARAVSPAAAAGLRQAAAAPIPSSDAPWFASLDAYLRAVTEHQPGRLDPAARASGYLGEFELTEARMDFLALVALCKREIARSVRSAPIVYRDTLIPYPELRRVLRLADDEAAKGNPTRILQRAAILHADVAMLVIPLLPGRMGCSSRATLLVKDGSRVGAGCINFHWTHSRLLLDSVRPDPGKDAIVRLWYQATITYLLEIGDFANGDLQIARARLLFPNDPAILFLHGSFHEGVASPYLQSAAQESGSDTRGSKVHLEEADDLYRRAVKQSPLFVEARLRRGHVLNLLGQPRDAAQELRLAADAASDTRLEYYAELFLGRAEESLGNRSEARDHYVRAKALYPGAQSPLFALAMLARQSGDRSGAQEAMGRLHALPGASEGDTDPWWLYYRRQHKGFEAAFAELRALIADGGAR